MDKIIGIDLGTTNSCVSVMEGGDAVIIPTKEGKRTMPSIVAFTKDGERLVGETAKRQVLTNTKGTVRSIKREMGSQTKHQCGGKKYTPPEISAMILDEMKQAAENYLGGPVTDAVITVPAYFTDAQRQATKDAGKIAGLNVKRIINEPTAAALAYGMDKEQNQKIVVYDLGGGTFDVSVLQIGDGVIEVMATAGDNHLGGDDFDQRVVEELIRRFKDDTGIDTSRDEVVLQRFKEAAETAKIELSSTPSTAITLPFLTADSSGPKNMDMTLTRARFDELTHDLVERTMTPFKQALSDAGITASEINHVLLVGGSTRIPAVQDAVKRFSGQEPFKGINPDECVAMGAAIQGGVLGGEVGGLLLLDVTPLSLGIETLGGFCTRLIDRNTTIPIERSQVFTTAQNFQTKVNIHVLQGERQMAKDNKTLGKFNLKGIKRAPKGVPQIEVTFNIDANGIVNVSVKDQATGKAQEITIDNAGGLSDSEINDAINEAERYKEEDDKIRSDAEVKSRAQSLLNRAETTLKGLDKTKKPEKVRIKDARKPVRKGMMKKDVSELGQACDELEAVLDEIAS